MIDRRDDDFWTVPAVWGAVTFVLIVITFVFDPLWAYYGSWGAGFLTAFSAMRAWILKTKQGLLESEDEALLLEVRQAKDAEGDEKLLHNGNAEGG